ncbi:MAG: hypothetical protein HC923_08930 [Myxococcales bacterium]|nr:hypothetical protein [Myxococcales bacterium]
MLRVRTVVRSAIPLFAASMSICIVSDAQARPEAPAAFCEQYPDSPHCLFGAADCAVCHTLPPIRNAFGDQLEAQWASPISPSEFLALLPAALETVEPNDADGDGFANRTEIDAGTFPGDARSFPVEADAESDPVVAFRS